MSSHELAGAEEHWHWGQYKNRAEKIKRICLGEGSQYPAIFMPKAKAPGSASECRGRAFCGRAPQSAAMPPNPQHQARAEAVRSRVADPLGNRWRALPSAARQPGRGRNAQHDPVGSRSRHDRSGGTAKAACDAAPFAKIMLLGLPARVQLASSFAKVRIDSTANLYLSCRFFCV